MLDVSLRTEEELEAYHGITLPYDDVVCGFDCLNMAWEVLVDFVCSVSTDDDHLTSDSVWVDNFHQPAVKLYYSPSRILTSSCGSIDGPTLIPLFCQLYDDDRGDKAHMGLAIPLKYST